MENMEAVLDRMGVIEVVNNVGFYADMHEWHKLRQCYADELELDYTSLVGGEPARLRADDLIAAWMSSLTQYQATQHMVTNHRVEISGTRATCIAYVQASHWLPNDSGNPMWEVNGYYRYTLVRDGSSWKITRHIFNARMVTGSRQILDRAGVRTDRW